jgi:hypothetical protein
MTIYELRLVMIAGLLALGALAMLAAFVVTTLKERASRADTRMAAPRGVSARDDDTLVAAGLIDRRQAAWRQRC